MIVRIYFLMFVIIIFARDIKSLGYRGLICLFDPHAVELPVNQNFALMAALLNTIQQQSAPLIISPSLWNNFIVRKYRFEKLSAQGPLELDQIIKFARDLFAMHGKFVMGAAYNPQDINAFIRKLALLYRTYFDYYTQFSNALNALKGFNKSTFFNSAYPDLQRRMLFNNFSVSTLKPPKELILETNNLFLIDLERDFLCYMTPFNASEWIIKQQKDLTGNVIFYVLFPKRYFDELAGVESTMTAVNRFIKFGQHDKGLDAQTEFERYGTRGTFIVKNGFLTKRELITGLKLDALDDASLVINDAHITIPAVSLDNYNFIDLFVTRRDLNILGFKERKEPLLAGQEEEREQLLAQWIILAYGHGVIEQMTTRRKLIEQIRYKTTDPAGAQAEIRKVEYEIKTLQEQGLLGGDIIGLHEKEFFRFIDFLNYMIHSRFLFYETCYGGGMHARFDWVNNIGVLPPGKDIDDRIRSYNYTLSSGALTDALSTVEAVILNKPPFISESHLIETLEVKEGQLRLRVPFIHNNQKIFFEGTEKFFAGKPLPKTKEKKEETLANLINYVHKFIAGSEFKFIGNIPLIRFPYTEWFRVPEMDKRVVRLTSVKIRSLYAKALIQKKRPLWEFADPSVVLLWPLKIPLILKLKNKMPTFISMVAGDVTHVIEELQASTIKARELFGAFFRIEGIEYEKMFIFNKLITNLDIPTIAQKGVSELNSCIVGFNVENLVPNQKIPLNMIYLTIKNNHYLATWDPKSKEINFSLGKLPSFRKLSMSSAQDAALVNNLMKRKTEKTFVEEKGIERKSLMEYELVTLARFILQREAGKKNLIAPYLSLRSNKIALEAWKKGLSREERKIIESFERAELQQQTPLEDTIQQFNFILDTLKSILIKK